MRMDTQTTERPVPNLTGQRRELLRRTFRECQVVVCDHDIGPGTIAVEFSTPSAAEQAFKARHGRVGLSEDAIIAASDSEKSDIQIENFDTGHAPGSFGYIILTALILALILGTACWGGLGW